MKKGLSLVTALATLVTVGGVYATWNYPGSSATTGSSLFQDYTFLSDATQAGAKGTISLDLSNFAMAIEDTNGDHKTELVFGNSVTTTADGVATYIPVAGAENKYVKVGEEEGYVTVTLTLNDTAKEDDTYKGKGFDLECVLSVPTDWKYISADISADIFTVKSDVIELKAAAVTKGENTNYYQFTVVNDYTFTWKIPAEELIDRISLTEVTLGDIDAYNAYHTALHAGSIKITVTEKTVQVGQN